MKKEGVRLRWVRGYVKCRVCGGAWERFMNMCRHHGICLWDITCKDDICFSMCADDFFRLEPLASKTAVRPHIIEKKGLPFWNVHIWKNWTFYSGGLFFFFLLFFFSSFVWEITYTGQRSYSKETLQKTVESMNVYAGMKRSRLDCDAIEKKIRELHPDISWVSAEEKGSLLRISIKEGKQVVEHDIMSEPKHLVALYDGVVQSISVNRGTACVKVGQRVKKGQILISGIVPVIDDNNVIVENIAVLAKGSVELLAEQSFAVPINAKYQKKMYTGKVITCWSGKAGNQSFLVKNPLRRLDNSYQYDIISTVCADCLIHPFEYPVHITKKEYREYKKKSAVYSREELKTVGMKKYQNILEQLTLGGMKLVSHSAVIKQVDESTWSLQGNLSFLCEKMGTQKIEQQEIIVEQTGGQDGTSGTDS